VHYKLRATVVRPGFAGLTHRELHAVHPITILRGFSPEALEYQQTLEIENTWPEKLMYSIMIPHKAWPAGDRLTAVVKFQPLVKGASVKSVTSMINETVKLTGRSGLQENTRTIASAKHDIVNGQAVCVEEQQHRYRIPLLHQSPGHTSSNASPVHTPLETRSHFLAPANSTQSPGEMTPLTTVTTNSSESSASGVASAAPLATPANTAVVSSTNLAGPSTSTAPPPPPLSDVVLPPEVEQEQSTDVVTTLHITIPAHATPGHSLEVCSHCELKCC
jgi:arrestin-related trafficking adapter 4/5/7